MCADLLRVCIAEVRAVKFKTNFHLIREMDCPHCQQRTPGIVEQNHLWCDQCGVSIRKQCEYVPSYNNQHAAARQQIYSRVKRFTKYAQQMCRDKPQVMFQMQKILDTYSSFEFTWVCHKDQSKRVYFFAKPVMLQACCKLLKIKSELPSLKDKNREKDQHAELDALQTTITWKMIYDKPPYHQT